MNRNDAHALGNIIQAAILYLEMGDRKRAIKTLLDTQLVLNVNAVDWRKKREEFQLQGGYTLALEALPDRAVFAEVFHRVETREIETPRAFALPCSTALEVAEHLMSWCHSMESGLLLSAKNTKGST